MRCESLAQEHNTMSPASLHASHYTVLTNVTKNTSTTNLQLLHSSYNIATYMHLHPVILTLLLMLSLLNINVQ